jgi:amino acid adenylation domain-containing protein
MNNSADFALGEKLETELAYWKEQYPRELSVSELFEVQAARTPEAIAVVVEDTALSYRELNERANQLARYLQRADVGPEMLVGILINRSVEMMVGVFGILKAGGAYVPLDPSYPLERLAFMVQDSGMRLLLTQRELLPKVPELEARTIVLDEEWEQIAAQSVLNPPVLTTPDNLAYVIYTSGSTGKPKGVQIQHRSLINLATAMVQRPRLAAGDVFLSLASLSFDMAVSELFPPLINGACVVVVSKEEAMDGELLMARLKTSGATVMQATPANWSLLLEAGWQGDKDLQVRCGAEAWGPKLAQELAARSSELWNMYGPTETTVWSTVSKVNGTGPVTLGMPIANTQLYVLDGHMQPVPIGVAGELYIAGDGVARGYLKRPELTAEKFVANPFSTTPGERMYRTGDLVRYRRDGELEYLERCDQQVKVRGFRIELGEIETVLANHPGLHEAVVVVNKDKNGDKRLVAYVAGDGEEVSATVLRGYLRKRLPEYMVPQAFVSLPALPLTPNGKIDRRALQALEVEFEGSGDQSVLARTPVEEILSTIWAEVLGLETVSVHDSFFELGGHSLLATQVISRIRKVFGQEVALRALLENPTVASLARTIEDGQLGVTGPKAPLIVRVERDGRAPASLVQQRLWFLDQLEPGGGFHNLPIVTKLTGTLNLEALESALTEIVRRHEVLRTTFSQIDGEPQQIISPAEPFCLPVIDLSDLPDEERQAEVMRLIREEAVRPFDLMRAPPLRMTLLRTVAEEHTALLTMHNIVSDGWSIAVFIRELAALYTAYCAGQPSPLEELPIQYADFAYWQRQWLKGDVLEQQLSYWRRQLAGAPTVELPATKPRPAIPTFRAAIQQVELSREVTEGLKALGRQTGVTLFMSLLAAFDVLLYRYGGQTDLPVATSVANRNQFETEALIGFFVNTLVLRADLSGDPTFIEVLQRVREVSLEAYAHQALPYEKLIEGLQADRRQNHALLSPVTFVLNNMVVDKWELHGLSLGTSHDENKTGKADLLLTMWETNDGMQGFFKYNTDIFEDSTIAKMVEHFQTLIQNLLADPQQRLSDSSFLTEDETMGLTCADFPESGLSQKDFESLILQLNSSSSLK